MTAGASKTAPDFKNKKDLVRRPPAMLLRYAKGLRASLSGRFFPTSNRGFLLHADKGSRLNAD
jgi:hypothetical protein